MSTSGGGQTSLPASASHHSSTPVGAIAGGVIGGVIFLGAVLLIAWLILRRRAQRPQWPTVGEPKENIDDVDYPHVTPFLPPAPHADVVGSQQSLLASSSPIPATATSASLLASSAQWPRSAEGKRALADASMLRVAEMEARVAQSPAAVDSEESSRLRREIDALQAQVGQLHQALEQQAAEIREGALYGIEAPPSYEEQE